MRGGRCTDFDGARFSAQVAAPSRRRWATDDADAISRARDGDLDAYEVLVARYSAPAYRTAALLAGASDADDAVQEAFVKAFAAMNSFRDGEPFRPWLLRIVANEALNQRRARTSRWRRVAGAGIAAGAEGFDSAADPLAVTLANERRQALTAAVRALPPRYQLVVTCRYFLELSEAETAELLGWPRGSVKSRLSRALARLRADLADLADLADPDDPAAPDDPAVAGSNGNNSPQWAGAHVADGEARRG